MLRDTLMHIEKSKRLGGTLENSPYASIVVEWIITDGAISSTEISNRLKKKFGYKVSSPTVTSWKKNYYPKHLKKIQEITDLAVVDSVAISCGLVESQQNYLMSRIETIVKSVDVIKERQAHTKCTNDDYVKYERLIIEWTKLEADLRKRFSELLGNMQYRQLIEDIIYACGNAAIRVFILDDENISLEELDVDSLAPEKKKKAKEFLIGIKAVYNKHSGDIDISNI